MDIFKNNLPKNVFLSIPFSYDWWVIRLYTIYNELTKIQSAGIGKYHSRFHVSVSPVGCPHVWYLLQAIGRVYELQDETVLATARLELFLHRHVQDLTAVSFYCRRRSLCIFWLLLLYYWSFALFFFERGWLRCFGSLCFRFFHLLLLLILNFCRLFGFLRWGFLNSFRFRLWFLFRLRLWFLFFFRLLFFRFWLLFIWLLLLRLGQFIGGLLNRLLFLFRYFFHLFLNILFLSFSDGWPSVVIVVNLLIFRWKNFTLRGFGLILLSELHFFLLLLWWFLLNRLFLLVVLGLLVLGIFVLHFIFFPG